MADASLRINRRLGGALLLMAVTSTGEKVDSAVPTTYRLPNYSSATELAPSLTPGEGCWRQIQRAYEEGNCSSSLGECEQVCGNITLKEIRLDWIRLTPRGYEGVECLMRFAEIRDRMSPDLYWFPSSESDSLVYLGNATAVVLTWDYLTRGQKALEAVFLLVVLATLKVTLVGNVLVTATTVGIAYEMNPWMVVRTSLAVSDLLRAAFVMTLAIHDSLRLMVGSPTTFDSGNWTRFPETPDVTYGPLVIREGYPSFCAMIFEATSVMSLQCLAWLTLERLLICRYIRAEKLLRPYGVHVIIMWLIAAAFPIITFWSDGSYSSFDPVTKLTFLLPGQSDSGVGHTTFLIQKAYLGALFLFTVIGSVLTMLIFRVRSKEELIELTTHGPMAKAEQQKADDAYITRSMALMLAAYLVSVSPYFLPIIPNLRRRARALYFASWWAFVLGSSWHWCVYNMRSAFFRSQASRLALPCLPSALGGRSRTGRPLPSTLDSNWERVWYELDDFLRRQPSKHETKSRGDAQKAKSFNQFTCEGTTPLPS